MSLAKILPNRSDREQARPMSSPEMRAGWMVAALLVGLAVQSMAAERVPARQNVPVISGGVGAESMARLQVLEKEFNLKLVFALVEGNYVADVGVTIRDASGRAVVEHVTDGPILLTRLPAGTYTVEARYGRQSQTRKLSVRGDRLQTEYLRWSSDPKVDFPGPAESRTEAVGSRTEAVAAARGASPGTPATVEFISGGIGETARAQMLSREKEFSLKLVFTLVEGNYVSDARVEIRDAAGRIVVTHLAEGPFFLARLPAGTYSVAAAYEGQTQTRNVAVVAGRLRTEHFRWKSNPQADSVLPPER